MKSDTEAASQSGPIYEAKGLKKEFDDGRVAALRGIDLRVNAGDFVSIVGPSGCGKTTFLNMLGSLDFPSSGQLLFKGTHIPDLPDPADYRARDIGFIFQSFHLLPTFTVEENVQIPMIGQGKSRSERKERALFLLEAVGLSHRRDHLPSKLSGGERQRAAIARSLVNDPDVLLADEPTGNLDSKTAVHITELLCQLQAEHRMTMILVTHDLGVARHAARIIRIKDGQIIAENDPADTASTPQA